MGVPKSLLAVVDETNKAVAVFEVSKWDALTEVYHILPGSFVFLGIHYMWLRDIETSLKVKEKDTRLATSSEVMFYKRKASV